MPGRSRVTREAILNSARRIISERGTASMTFQALGETLGVSKQAIIYWFPSKSDLARELILPALLLEAEATSAPLLRVRTARRALEVFLRAFVAFHLEDMGRFRLIYVTAQFDPEIWQIAGQPEVMTHVHAATSRMYGALQDALERSPDFGSAVSARRAAVATHMAAVGIMSMLSVADAMHDPLAHDTRSLVDSLVALITGRMISAR